MKLPRWPLWALPPAALAGAWGWWLAGAQRAGEVRWKSWEHPLPQPWEWAPFIHPPLFAWHQRFVEAQAGGLGMLPGELLAYAAAALAPIVVLLAAWLASPREGEGPWAAYAALLMAISPTMLRPFEQYPASRLVVAVALLAVLGWARRGGRGLGVVAFLAALLATQTHLSVWFLLGPLLVFLTVPLADRRRGLAVLTIGLLVAFWILAGPNPLYANTLLDVFDQPGVHQGHIFSRASKFNYTFEVSNPWLFAPLLLWLAWPLWKGEPRGLPLVASIGTYVVAHLALQRRGYAIHAQAPQPHHYFELVEVVAIAAWTWLLIAAWRRWPTRWVKAAVVLAAVAVLVTQALGFWDTLEDGIHRADRWKQRNG